MVGLLKIGINIILTLFILSFDTVNSKGVVVISSSSAGGYRRHKSGHSSHFSEEITKVEVDEEKPIIIHPNQQYPGGVTPPLFIDKNIHTEFSKIRYELLPPPPGFLNSPNSGGSAPEYTYYIPNYFGRNLATNSSNETVQASIAIWEINKHRSHYRIYHSSLQNEHSVPEIKNNVIAEAGKIYFVTPNNITCYVNGHSFNKNMLYRIECGYTGKDFDVRVILPNNKTDVIKCAVYEFSFSGTCSGSKTIDKEELIPVEFEVFDEVEYYGGPLCNLSVVNEVLVLGNQNGICLYPPYKWDGGKWTTIQKEERERKLMKNMDSLYDLTKLQDKTLHVLALSMHVGKIYIFNQ